MRILIAEDDRQSRHDLERHLQSWGHEPLVAVDVDDARRTLESDTRISLLLTARFLSDGDGLDLCRQARELKRSRYLPIVVFSSRGDEKGIAEALEAGADGFLSKPIRLPELQASLRLMERLLFLEERLALELRNIEEAYGRIEELAQTDDLTKVANRRAILDRMEQEIARVTRYGSPLSALLVDIDHFKDFNDTHGPAAGDMALRKLAEILAQSIRTSDIVGRYSGEEFLIVLPSVGRNEALHTAERLRRDIEKTPLPLGGPESRALTVSIGVAEFDRERDTPGSLITRADRALYQAKSRGNRVHAGAM